MNKLLIQYKRYRMLSSVRKMMNDELLAHHHIILLWGGEGVLKIGGGGYT